MNRTCKTCNKSFDDLSIENDSWVGITSKQKDPLKDDWIYCCPFCNSIFKRTHEEWKTDSANKVLEMLELTNKFYEGYSWLNNNK